MSNLSFLSGTVSHGRNVSYSTISHETKFRIDDRSIYFCNESNLAIGDWVSVVGREKNNNEFEALAIRNDSTGAEYSISAGDNFFFGCLALIIGIVFGALWLYLCRAMQANTFGYMIGFAIILIALMISLPFIREGIMVRTAIILLRKSPT